MSELVGKSKFLKITTLSKQGLFKRLQKKNGNKIYNTHILLTNISYKRKSSKLNSIELNLTPKDY